MFCFNFKRCVYFRLMTHFHRLFISGSTYVFLDYLLPTLIFCSLHTLVHAWKCRRCQSGAQSLSDWLTDVPLARETTSRSSATENQALVFLGFAFPLILRLTESLPHSAAPSCLWQSWSPRCRAAWRTVNWTSPSCRSPCTSPEGHSTGHFLQAAGQMSGLDTETPVTSLSSSVVSLACWVSRVSGRRE